MAGRSTRATSPTCSRTPPPSSPAPPRPRRSSPTRTRRSPTSARSSAASSTTAARSPSSTGSTCTPTGSPTTSGRSISPSRLRRASRWSRTSSSTSRSAGGRTTRARVYLMQYGLGDAGNNAIHGGHVKKLARDTVNASAPTTLSGTFLFKTLNPLVPADNLVPYTVASPLWSDGAVKQRWIMVAGRTEGVAHQRHQHADGRQLQVPDRHVAHQAVRHGHRRAHARRGLAPPRDARDGRRQRHHLRLFFRWRPDGSDADIVRDGEDQTLTDSTGATRDWHYPSPGQCWGCHRNGWEDQANTIRNEKYPHPRLHPGAARHAGDDGARSRAFSTPRSRGPPVLPTPRRHQPDHRRPRLRVPVGQLLAVPPPERELHRQSADLDRHLRRGHARAALSRPDRVQLSDDGEAVAGLHPQSDLDQRHARRPRLAGHQRFFSVASSRTTPTRACRRSRATSSTPDGAAIIRAWIAAGAPAP